MTYHPPTRLPYTKELQHLVRRYYPRYTGRTFYVQPTESVYLLSHWDGGHRDYFIVVNTRTGEGRHVQQSGTMFDRREPETLELTPDLVVIRHSYNGSQRQSVTFLVHPDAVEGRLLALAGR